jgi:2-polyprenyl-3-methyl-5-hydroxy-6-metoxy-1,4-benzoquinol methylase/thioredoxin-like negative regulator of GroEL
MRVFETMASGALLVTDEADGLEDLFEDGKHLVVYRRDEDLLAVVERYLADHDARDRIAAEGQALVLSRHTYAHRMAEILEKAQATLDLSRKPSKVGRPKVPDYYAQPRRELIPHVPLKARRILEIGCGAGAFCAELRKERRIEEVVGVEIVRDAYEKAVKVLDRVFFGNIEEMELPFAKGYFDAVICADVLEHLRDPWTTLRRLGTLLAPDGVVVISIPNIRFHEIIQMLSHGAWTYMDMGIMDNTHLRFFTRAELYTLVERAGLELAEIMPLNARAKEDYPLDEDGALTMGKVKVHGVTEAEHEEFLAYQYIVVACHPGPDRLEPAREALARRQFEAAFSLAVDAVGVDEFERNLLLARSSTRLGNLERAERFYQRALEIRTEAEVLGDLGILQLAMNNRDVAWKTLGRSLELNPDLARARGAFGMLCTDVGRHAEAIEHLKTALEANHENHQLLGYLIASAEYEGRIEEVLPLLASYVEFYPGNLELSVEYARLLMIRGRTQEARALLEQVTMFNPDHAAARSLIAELEPQDDAG